MAKEDELERLKEQARLAEEQRADLQSDEDCDDFEEFDSDELSILDLHFDADFDDMDSCELREVYGF